MALVPCPECHQEVSTRALACPRCAFPFPGEHGLSEDLRSQKLHSCHDCGFLISKQARSCPHCGVATREEQTPRATNGDTIEETWLCPHCGTSYTRNVSRNEEKSAVGHQVPISIADERTMEVSPKLTPDQVKVVDIPEPQRKQSPLWQDSSFPTKKDYDLVSNRYPRNRKKHLMVGFIIAVLVVASIALGALWQLQGINPLEALVYWRM